MLILSRRVQESIIIGDRLITFTVLGIVGGQVRIGIDAPKRIEINREEVFRKIEMQRKETAAQLAAQADNANLAEQQGSAAHEVG